MKNIILNIDLNKKYFFKKVAKMQDFYLEC